MFQEYPGYAGMFSRDQAAGAIPNGTCVSKIWAEPGDTHEIGEFGTVLGSVECPPELHELDPRIKPNVKFLYFVEWDNMPKVAVGVIDKKIAKWIG